MTLSIDGDQLLERIRADLDASAESLDDMTVSRLRAARMQALERASARRPRPALAALGLGQWSLPAGALASVAATVLALSMLTHSGPDNGLEVIDDIELLTSGEELEFYRDLEFYQWLEESGLAG